MLAELGQGASEAPTALLEDGAAADPTSLATTAASANALALAEAARPLSELLRNATPPDPDWRTTMDLTNSPVVPTQTAEQQAVLTAATHGNVTALAAALDACPSSELPGAVLQPAAASPLHLAATAGAVDCVRLLLDRGLSVHAMASNGSSALHWAAGGGHTDVVAMLLHAGASTRTRSSTWRSTVRGNDSGQTPAHWAAGSGHDETLEVLLQHDPHALLMQDERQLAPAAVAARDGHPWLQSALERLEGERMVCVRVIRDATMQRVLGSRPAADEEATHEATPLRTDATLTR